MHFAKCPLEILPVHSAKPYHLTLSVIYRENHNRKKRIVCRKRAILRRLTNIHRQAESSCPFDWRWMTFRIEPDAGSWRVRLRNDRIVVLPHVNIEGPAN